MPPGSSNGSGNLFTDSSFVKPSLIAIDNQDMLELIRGNHPYFNITVQIIISVFLPIAFLESEAGVWLLGVLGGLSASILYFLRNRIGKGLDWCLLFLNFMWVCFKVRTVGILFLLSNKLTSISLSLNLVQNHS
jgi:hypothetical protein